MRLAIVFTLEALVDVDGCADVALSAARARNIAEHVLPDRAPFLAWCERVVQRLEQLYPFDEDDPTGNVVPREALDPEFEFEPAMTSDLVNRSLANLDYDSNRFLRAPDEMRARDFSDTPYEFTMEADRIARHDF